MSFETRKSTGGGGDTLPIVDTTAIVKGSVDDTKLVRIEADGLTTGTTRVITMADADVDLADVNDLPVANLADGTDGELITWDASGNPATVGAGTANQVLTSNGPGTAPTFQDPSGGGTPTTGVTAGSTGNQDITHGLGAIPSLIIIEARTASDSSHGYYDGSNNGCAWDSGIDTSNCIRAISVTAYISAVSSTTFTITWNAGGSSIYLRWMAYA